MLIQSGQLHERKRNRLEFYDYAQNGCYFVTFCVKNRINIFGDIVNDKMVINEYGGIVNKQWRWLGDQYQYVKLDEYIIMPNHFHGILIIENLNGRRIDPRAKCPDSRENCIDSRINCGGSRENCIDSRINCGGSRENCMDSRINCGGSRENCMDSRENCGDSRENCIDSRINCGGSRENCIDSRINCGGRDRSRPVPTAAIYARPVHQGKIKSLSELIGAFKTTSSKLIHRTGLEYFQWQRSFYDHIIRDEQALNNIRRYIQNNPSKWSFDRNKQENLYY